jgi:Tfp pilus assembly protein FimT
MELRATPMTLTTGINRRRRGDAFTLVELMLVMAILIIAASLITPKLTQFFGGRSADSEARKLQALMHYGQSRAVSEGVPMMLWVDSAKGTYGLEQEPGYNDSDPRAVENRLDGKLKISVTKNAVKTPQVNSQTGRILSGQAKQSKTRLPAVYFMPDGSISEMQSVASVSIQYSNDPPVVITATAGAGGK